MNMIIANTANRLSKYETKVNTQSFALIFFDETGKNKISLDPSFGTVSCVHNSVLSNRYTLASPPLQGDKPRA